jgi:hypothetical protein
MKIPPELLTVAKHLGVLTEETVFVGGMIRGLLITDPAAGAARPTDDVDVIVNVPTYKAFNDLGKALRGLGFSESMEEGDPICRWVVDGIRTDIMPIDPSILGFTNVWYAGAMDHAVVVAGPDGNFRTLDAPHFCATKLEAFSARGDGDYLHRDIEDFIAVVDGRVTLMGELSAAPGELRMFVATVVSELLATESFVDALPGHLEGDVGSQARLPLLIARLRGIAALRQPRKESSPTESGLQPGLPTTARASVFAPGMPTASRGSVPLPGMPFSVPAGRIELRSSNLRALEYESSNRKLTIEFHSGGIYRYSNVPETVVQGLLRAYSAGRYFHQWIKSSYPSNRIR